mmetsp:Transcript_19763/g.17470  ORF Transcript_19763/g.17470 Transcript_19763/m.17470 type:complete len:83 (+) Transcript_19763:342-590(+)
MVNSSKSERRLDAATLPLGKQLELGIDPQAQLDSLDKQLFDWNVEHKAKTYKEEDLSSAYYRHTLIPDELKSRSDLKTNFLM